MCFKIIHLQGIISTTKKRPEVTLKRSETLRNDPFIPIAFTFTAVGDSERSYWAYNQLFRDLVAEP
jgi:hypothetical protein